MNLRVMTYNIRAGVGMDGRKSLRRVANTIRGVQPDIVCLQELHSLRPWFGFNDQFVQMQHFLGMNMEQMHTATSVFTQGIAIASRFPIHNVSRIKLPSHKEQRGCLRVELCAPQGPVTAFCTHLGLSFEERSAQILCLGRAINLIDSPAIVCGDFNEDPGVGNIDRLLKEANLVDAGANASNTYPSNNPTHRIDYVLHTREWKVVSSTVVESQASDHLPFVVELVSAF
jgi:endonuclease/exonuclease/phosphatase family metal-dependent hydrolase